MKARFAARDDRAEPFLYLRLRSKKRHRTRRMPMQPRMTFWIAVAAALFIHAAGAIAQTTPSPLPDVTVTAPAPIQRVNPFQPFSGNTRVDEAKWPVIPCANARIDLGAGARCQTGTPVETFLTMSTGGRCDIARQVAMIDNPRYQIEADV